MLRSCGGTAAGCGNPGTPHRSRSGWATPETPAARPVTPCSSPPGVDRCCPSPPRRTFRLECLQKREKSQHSGTSGAPSLFMLRCSCSFCTWGVWLDVSYGWRSPHGDELGPELRRFLKNQEDPQSLEWAAARVPGGDKYEHLYRARPRRGRSVLRRESNSRCCLMGMWRKRWGSHRVFKVNSCWPDDISPFHNGVVGPEASGQQVVPVVEQLVVFAAVSDPQVRHAGNATGQTQQVLLRTTVLVCYQQTLIRRFTLQRKQRRIHYSALQRSASIISPVFKCPLL